VPPRKRNPENVGLPARWRYTRNAYYYQVPPGLEHLWDGKKTFRLGSNLPDAHREYAKRIEIDEGDIRTFNQAFDRYMLEVVPTKAPATQTDKLGAIKKLRPVFGAMHPTSFKPKYAYKYRDIRGKESPTAANHEMELMSHLCTKLIEWGVIETHPMIDGKFRKLSVPARERYVEDWEIIEALSITSKRKRGSVLMCQAYIKLKLLTGMRRTDMLLLNVSTDIKVDGIHITASKTQRSSGKKTIYGWDDEGLLKKTLQECLSTRPVDIGPYLFCNRKGEPYFNIKTGKANGFDSIWKRYMDRVVKETKVTERIWEKDLRAKCATDADSLEHARALLSHTSTKTTKIYRRKAEVVKPGKGVKS